jgi:serine/threonine-protein phosphatase 2A regulatory subunit B
LQDFTGSTHSPLKWYNLAVLGETDASSITKQDLLSSISFDKHGNYLAVGDRGGRIIVF